MSKLSEAQQLDQEAVRLERQLTPEQKDKAFAMALANGWKPGSQPPTAFWITWFREAMKQEE